MTTGTESLALAAVSAALSGVAADVARAGGLPVEANLLTTVGMFAVVSMLTAIGASAVARRGAWGAGKTVANGMAWGAVAAGFCELREVDRAWTLLVCAALGPVAEVLVSKFYAYVRDADTAAVLGFVRSMVLAAFRIPIPPQADPPPKPPRPQEDETL